MFQPISTGSIRESADRVCRFRPIKGDGFRTALEITRRCNIACLHCFVPNERSDPELEMLQELIVALQRAGCQKLILTGGEPLLRDDLTEIVRAATVAGVGVDLNSNLVGLQPERADALIDAGLAEASVSLYGDQAFHDAFVRSTGAFESTMRSCRMLRERNVELDIHGPIWAENLQHAEYIHDQAQQLGAESMTLFQVIGLAGSKEGRLFGKTRFATPGEQFSTPPLDELARCVSRLRERGTVPLRTIGFWGSVRGECEQGCSILGLTSNRVLSPCLLSRRTTPLERVVHGGNLRDTIELLRDEVRQGLWVPVCNDGIAEASCDEPIVG